MTIAGLVIAYLLGSTPFAYAAGRLLKGIDLRNFGSGNLGTTNVLRTLGVPAAIVVLALDALKGAIPALYFARWFAAPAAGWWPIVFGTLAIVGHVKPYFGVFRGGGKGVATASGVFAALAPAPFLVALAAFGAIVATTRLVSLGSVCAAVVLVVAMAVMRGATAPLTAASAIVCAFVLWTHRANIGRLRRGEESRLGRKVAG